MRFLIFLFIVLFSYSCSDFSSYCTNEDEKLVNNITSNVSLKLKKEHGLLPLGSGAQMMHEVKMLHLAFEYHESISIETGRKFLVDAVREFTTAVNSESKIHRYLSNYPFNANNISIEIYLQKHDGAEFDPTELALVRANQGKLEYKAVDPVSHRLITVFEETYEEALKASKTPR
jgi:hypothetical protein